MQTRAEKLAEDRYRVVIIGGDTTKPDGWYVDNIFEASNTTVLNEILHDRYGGELRADWNNLHTDLTKDRKL